MGATVKARLSFENSRQGALELPDWPKTSAPRIIYRCYGCAFTSKSERLAVAHVYETNHDILEGVEEK